MGIYLEYIYLQPGVGSRIRQLSVIDQVGDLHAGTVCCPSWTIFEAALHRPKAFIESDILIISSGVRLELKERWYVPSQHRSSEVLVLHPFMLTKYNSLNLWLGDQDELLVCY